MIQSMTGFGSSEGDIPALGKISVELRSTNHKFLESVFHLPEELLYLEDKVKRSIEARIKRGRLTCVVSVMGGKGSGLSINNLLLANYMAKIKRIKEQFGISDDISINTLIHLPGVISLGANRVQRANLWPKIKTVVDKALEDLMKMRQKEGRATFIFLKSRADSLGRELQIVKTRFKRAVKERSSLAKTDEERASFLKDADIAEEMERLSFHIRNFKNKLGKNGPVGKELDFIAQEMQREANTMAAKSFLASISARVVQIKSQIEKIREQVQNIE